MIEVCKVLFWFAFATYGMIVWANPNLSEVEQNKTFFRFMGIVLFISAYHCIDSMFNCNCVTCMH